MAEIFSIAYFLANWAFIVVFTFVFTRGLFFQQRQPFLDVAVDRGLFQGVETSLKSPFGSEADTDMHRIACLVCHLNIFKSIL